MAQAKRPRRTRSMRRRRNGSDAATRAKGERVLAQGVGRTASNAFGSRRAHGGGDLACWDATRNEHLPLPRPVAPYTVVRTTALISTSAKYIQFGTYGVNQNKDTISSGFRWTNTCALADVDASLAVNATNNTRPFSVPTPGNEHAQSVVPSALTVQLMNPEALQTTSGIIAGGVCNTQLNLCGRTETYDKVAEEFLSFQRPRLMAAAKLALRGVTASSVPLNMNKVSEFAPMATIGESPISWDGDTTHYNKNIAPVGWAPIVFVNYGHKGEYPELQFLVTMEWRVRFDIGNPAVASHRDHGTSSDQEWGAKIKQALKFGNQVRDIAETVANIGAAGVQAYQTLRGPVQVALAA